MDERHRKFGQGITRTAYSPTADVFLSKFTNSGDCIWAFNFGGIGSTANNICAGLSVDQENNPIITGQLYGTDADVDPGSGIFNLSSAGNNDCFLIKYTSAGQLWTNDSTATGFKNPTVDLADKVVIYPNPASSHIKIQGIRSDTRSRFEIIDFHGNISQYGIISGQPIDISSLPGGIYLIRAEGTSGRFMKRVMVLR